MRLALVLILLAGAASAEPSSGDDDLARLPAHLLGGARAQLDLEGLSTLALSGAAYYVVKPNDADVRSDVLAARPFGRRAALAVTEGGDGLVLFPLSAAFYAAGRLGKTAWAADLGMLSFEALLLSGIEAQILKYAVQRERPDGSDHYSFPSGHAASSFSVATILAGEYGWKAAIPAYAAASAVGYSRLELDKHWLSDVVFGAGLGIASGRAALRAKRRRRGGRQRVTWAPVFGPSSAGVVVSF